MKQVEKVSNRIHELKKQLDDDTIPYHRKQIISASIVMLKEMLNDKNRDVKRRLKGS